MFTTDFGSLPAIFRIIRLSGRWLWVQ